MWRGKLGRNARRSHGARGRYQLDYLESRVLLAAGPELWFYVQTNLQTDSNVTKTKTLIDRASAAGYTYMMLADTKLSYDGGSYWDSSLHLPRLRDVINYATSKGITFVPATYELGRADWVSTLIDKNLIEGQAVVGANFTVNAGKTALTFNPQNPALNNPSFTSASSWNLDARASIDTTTGHTGSSSLKIAQGGGRGLAIQTITLIPHRQYQVSYWVKATADFTGDHFIKIYDPAQPTPHFLEDHQYEPALKVSPGNANWQLKQYVFNSGNSTSVQFRVGTWGGTTGSIWFDDVAITETALHNVVRNPSSPLKIYKSDGTILVEGVDFNPVQDLTAYALNKTPLTVTLPAGTSLMANEQVKIDYDAAQPVEQGQYSLSTTAPAMQTYYRNVTTQLRKSFAPGTPVMVGGYDEIRSGNSSTVEYAMGKTAGQLLADSFLATYNSIRSVDPTAPIYTWSDMFDKYHNARDYYYLWNGDLSAGGGSWQSLPDDVTIMNWNIGTNPDNLNLSLKFFAGLGNSQIIAGYYGAADGYAQAQSEVSRAVGAANVRGLMFTVWNGVYDELEDYAAGAKAAWASLITPPTVTAVHVKGTTWSSAFLSSLAGSGQGSATLGYRIPTGSNQLKVLPWANINQVSITFNENVTVAQAALALTGINVPSYGVASFAYNSTTRTATWTLNAAIDKDMLQITLPTLGAYAVADTAGNPLDGEWIDGTSTISGNGITGGNFSFTFKVLAGDVDGSGTVDLTDLAVLGANWQTAGSFRQGDVNGNLFVDLTDLAVLGTNWQTSLPSTFGAMSFATASSIDDANSTTPVSRASKIKAARANMLLRAAKWKV